MSAYKTLTGFANSLKNEIPNEELQEQIERLVDYDILSVEEIEQCKGVCAAFGVEYPGISFQVFLTKNNDYSVVLPRIYSTGKVAVLEWGNKKFELQGAKPATKFRNTGAASGFFFKKFEDFFVQVELKPDDKPGDRTYLQSLAGFDDEDCLTWEASLPFILVRAPKADRQVLLDAGGFTILTCEKVKGKAKEDGKDSFYWNANIIAGDSPYMAFLPGDVDFQAGDIIAVQDKKFVLKRTGVEFNLGLNFEKLSKLAIGEHVVVGVEAAKGDFGGFNLILDDGKIVTANAKIRDWISCLDSLSTISAENPAILTVGASSTMRNGKTQTQVFIKLKNSVGFFSKFKSGAARSDSMAKPIEPVTSTSHANNAVSEPSRPVASNDAATATASPATAVNGTVPATGIDIKDPWL